MFGEAGHKILHRARSMRRMRHDDQPTHKRAISSSSHESRASSSGSDTSRRENSVDWDPLRLHPAMEVDHSPHITPPYHGARPAQAEEHSPQEQYFHHQPRHTHTGAAMQIYGGFDFGFEKPQQMRDSTGARRLRQPKSEADLKQQAASKADDEEPQWRGLHSPSRRQAPTGFDEADYFIKRGGWKRRGIVFGGFTEEAHESEDDVFEIP
jgi:hypothetical protein